MDPYGKKQDLFTSTLNAYSQIFFSDHIIFGILIFIVTFFDFWSGLTGFISVLTVNLMARAWGYNPYYIQKGLYGYNPLLVGIALGMTYEPSLLLILLIIVSAILTLFIQIMMQGLLGKYYLPYLSLPFLISIWMILLAAEHFPSLNISHRGLYELNTVYSAGGIKLVKLYDFFSSIRLPNAIIAYFSSLSAVFFQFNVMAGIFVAAGLLIYSRIAFTLSLIGFYSAYFFYKMLGVDTSTLLYSYTGFNYILTAIAIGGYFVIPSFFSYVVAVFTIPLVAILSTSLFFIFQPLHLNIYSLPFNIAVLLFLYAIKNRTKKTTGLSEVYIQQYSPEKNLYSFSNYNERFNSRYPVNFKLPFMGFWEVSQGHNGEYTHQDEWRHAWDFIINGSDGKQFRKQGMFPEDYYCYNKAITAAADGIVETIIDGIDDNIIGQMNIKDNWGNTIIIRHQNNLFSKYSHLKKGSIKVRHGDTVKQGQVIAHCGNSGRSPYPHLHFQIQSTPYVGSKTTDYPFSYYLIRKDKTLNLKTFSRPSSGDQVSNIDSSPFISNAFNFIPGKSIVVTYRRENKTAAETWTIQTNSYNNSFIESDVYHARAYFYNDGNIHYFTHYEGSRKSMLYYFFIGCHKIQFGLYPDLIIEDFIALNAIIGKYLFLHDFIAPFKMLFKVKYISKIEFIDNEITPSKIRLRSGCHIYFLNKEIKSISIQIHIDEGGIKKLTIDESLAKREIEWVTE